MAEVEPDMDELTGSRFRSRVRIQLQPSSWLELNGWKHISVSEGEGRRDRQTSLEVSHCRADDE